VSPLAREERMDDEGKRLKGCSRPVCRVGEGREERPIGAGFSPEGCRREEEERPGLLRRVAAPVCTEENIPSS
jgi:hypothetical protein